MEKIVYLASFQKSGNTWVSFILANIYNQIDNKFEEIDFFNIHEINPEFKNHLTIEPVFENFSQIMTTHSHFMEMFENVILLIRNPWDVLYSYFHYLKGERLLDVSLPDLVKDEKRGIKAIISHNLSFLKNHKRLLIITYENMHQEPLKEVKKITDFIGLSVQNPLIKTAIKKASFKSMRNLEIRKGRKFGNPKFIFTRRGKVGEGQKILKNDSNLNDYITNEIQKSPLLNFLYGNT